MGMAGIGEVSTGWFFFFFCAAAADEKRRKVMRAAKQRTQALREIMQLSLLTATKNSMTDDAETRGLARRVGAFGTGTALHGAGETEAVIGVLKIGRDAGAGGAARHLCRMAPGTSARGAPCPFRRTLRIAIGGDGVVAGIEPVGAPFVDIRADVEKAESVLLCAAHGFGSLLPSRGIICQRFERGVAPGIDLLLEPPARGAFPFGFGGQAVVVSSALAEPFAIGCGIEPRRRDDGLLGMGENGIVPVERYAMPGGGKELRVLGVGQLACG